MAKKTVVEAVALELPVSYGGVSIGDATCKVSVKVNRSSISLRKADEFLCGKRLEVIIKAAPVGQADQPPIPGFEGDNWQVEGTADAKGFSVSPKAISFGLTFMLESVDIETLSHFAKRDGRVLVANVLGDSEEEDGED